MNTNQKENSEFDSQKMVEIPKNIFRCESCNKRVDEVDNYCKHCGNNLKLIHVNSANKLSFVIDCVKNLPFDAGLNYVSKILKGSKSILKRGNQKSDFCNYGIFSDDTIKQTKVYLDELVNQGFLELYTVPKSANLKVKIGDMTEISEELISEKILFESKIENEPSKDNAIQAGESWSDLLDQELEFLYAKQMSIIDLMAHFERSRGGITARLKRLGLME